MEEKISSLTKKIPLSLREGKIPGMVERDAIDSGERQASVLKGSSRNYCTKVDLQRKKNEATRERRDGTRASGGGVQVVKCRKYEGMSWLPEVEKETRRNALLQAWTRSCYYGGSKCRVHICVGCVPQGLRLPPYFAVAQVHYFGTHRNPVAGALSHALFFRGRYETRGGSTSRSSGT